MPTPRRYTHFTADDDLVPYCQRRTPLLPPTEDAQRYRVLVTRWSGIDFTRPVPLVDRRDLVPGDVIASSHGYVDRVAEVQISEHPTSTDLVGTPHLNTMVGLRLAHHRSERHEGKVPLLADADGTVFGDVDGLAGGHVERLVHEPTSA